MLKTSQFVARLGNASGRLGLRSGRRWGKFGLGLTGHPLRREFVTSVGQEKREALGRLTSASQTTQDKPYLTGSPPSRQKMPIWQRCQCADYKTILTKTCKQNNCEFSGLLIRRNQPELLTRQPVLQSTDPRSSAEAGRCESQAPPPFHMLFTQ